MITVNYSCIFNDVRDSLSWQLINGLSGVRTWTSTKRMTAPSGFFMRIVRVRLSMVGRTGQPKGWPGFFVDRFLTPVRFTTHIVRNVVVNPFSIIHKGFTHE